MKLGLLGGVCNQMRVTWSLAPNSRMGANSFYKLSGSYTRSQNGVVEECFPKINVLRGVRTVEFLCKAFSLERQYLWKVNSSALQQYTEGAPESL